MVVLAWYFNIDSNQGTEKPLDMVTNSSPLRFIMASHEEFV